MTLKKVERGTEGKILDLKKVLHKESISSRGLYQVMVRLSISAKGIDQFGQMCL
jgi:hypothetical protein